jgi:hypothetical protein
MRGQADNILRLRGLRLTDEERCAEQKYFHKGRGGGFEPNQPDKGRPSKYICCARVRLAFDRDPMLGT